MFERLEILEHMSFPTRSVGTANDGRQGFLRKSCPQKLQSFTMARKRASIPVCDLQKRRAASSSGRYRNRIERAIVYRTRQKRIAAQFLLERQT